ncbi:MAG: Flp pilus assembly complex ATPase component TadA, partial [Gammaproteobacteria bacterium]|nr:Flp pilus assembly complex ATPase component TadA [Gammaproteobacteria bacterium]
HIITIEDPIEYIHQHKNCLIDQREVGHQTKTFDIALRAALREDPDYILVGEMRDLETIRMALTAAETGHLVFATLHTSSAAKTVNRIIDVFPLSEKDMVRSMLAESLQAVISQRLVKKITGGRTVAQEIMVCNTAIRNMIREGKTHQLHSSIQTGQNIGMQTLEQALQQLVDHQVITELEASINISSVQD